MIFGGRCNSQHHSHLLDRLSGKGADSTVEGSGKDQVNLVLKAGHGMTVQDDLVVQANIHLGGKTDFPIKPGLAVIFDFVIRFVYTDPLDSDQFGEHIPSLLDACVFVLVLLPLFCFRA
jgi:hypothetical protein